MTLLRQSQIHRLTEPRSFVWAAGIEDTFISAPWPKTGRTLDEYELTGHYDRCEADLGLMADYGARVAQTARRGLRWRMPYASAEIVEKLGMMYWEKYHAPLFISETASVGSVGRRSAWLEESVAAVRRLRARGVPMVGYTWWPLFALVKWAYRQGTRPAACYLKQMGLWDLDAELRRWPTSLVDQFMTLTQTGVEAVGVLDFPAHLRDSRRPDLGLISASN